MHGHRPLVREAHLLHREEGPDPVLVPGDGAQVRRLRPSFARLNTGLNLMVIVITTYNDEQPVALTEGEEALCVGCPLVRLVRRPDRSLY